MPTYAKFLKEIVANKKKLEEYAMVALTEECSAILMNKYPPKLKDPGSFSIPCTFGKLENVESLCDLGASVNLMPSSIFKRLGIGELTPTTIKLQLADRSIKQPLGVAENILVKVGKFFFPADFYVLDMDDACDTPIILGRPFLATSGVCIDLTKGSIIFRVGSECEEFHVSKNVHTQLLDHDKNRVHSLETCCMISKNKPLVCPKEGKLNDKPSAKEREDKKWVESGNKKIKRERE